MHRIEAGRFPAERLVPAHCVLTRLDERVGN